MSDTSRAQLAYAPESTFAAQVTGANLQILNYTGEGLKQNSSFTRSGSIRSDRQVPSVRRSRFETAGSVNFELLFGGHEDLIAAALQSAGWSSPVTVSGTTIAAVASGNKYTDSGNGFGSIVVGQWVKVSGFVNAANNGLRKVTAAAAGEITVSGAALVDEAAGQSVTVVQGAQIVNGTTLVTYNLERSYTDLSQELALYLGQAVNGFSMDVPEEGPVTCVLDFIGAQEQSLDSSGGTGYTAAVEGEIFTGGDLTSLLENQASMGILGVNFRLNNNLRTRKEAGPSGVISIGSGTIELTGALRAYYSDSTFYDKYLNETATSIAVALTDPDGNIYLVDMPQVKITDGQRVVSGPNGDTIADVQFEAYRDSSEDTTIRLAKFAA